MPQPTAVLISAHRTQETDLALASQAQAHQDHQVDDSRAQCDAPGDVVSASTCYVLLRAEVAWCLLRTDSQASASR